MALKIERDTLNRIIAKHIQDPLTEDFSDEIMALECIDLDETASLIPELDPDHIDKQTAFDYGREILPVFFEGKFLKIGEVLLGARIGQKAPDIRWTVIDRPSWAVGSLASMQLVQAVTETEGYKTTLQTVSSKNNQWGLRQWTAYLSFLGPYPSESLS